MRGFDVRALLNNYLDLLGLDNVPTRIPRL